MGEGTDHVDGRAPEPAAGAARRRSLAPMIVALAAIVILQVGAAWLVLGHDRAPSETGLLLKDGYPVGGDFVLYYATSRLARAEGPVAVYDSERLHAVEKQVLGGEVTKWPWFYPPTLLLGVYPLSYLPYLAALGVWVGLGLVLYLVVAYRILPHRLTLLFALLFPAAGDSLFSGQNGCFNAVLIGAGLLALERRPWLAGVLFGLLTYKPHIGWLIAVALLAGGHWRAVAGAAATAVALVLVSLAVFGIEPWGAFIDGAALARHAVEVGLARWFNMPTMFVAARMLGVGVTGAWVVQVAIALVAAALVAWTWRRPLSLGVRGSILVLAIPLATPYAQFYDLAILMLPILWLAAEGGATGWLRGERIALAGLWAAPVAAQIIAERTVLQIWPLVLVAMLALVLRRASRAPGPA